VVRRTARARSGGPADAAPRGVYTETAFVEETDDGAFLYYYMETANRDAALAAGDEEAFDIDEEHHEVLEETLTDESREMEPVGHFVDPDRP
jgi:hypothetical protein